MKSWRSRLDRLARKKKRARILIEELDTDIDLNAEKLWLEEAQRRYELYEAGYYPTNNRFEGEYRNIRVLARSQDGRMLRVEFSPKGYYAKKELRNRESYQPTCRCN